MENLNANFTVFEETDLSANMEDYIETIALLSKKSKVVRVKDIAKSLNIKMPSVSAALIKLRDKELIEYEKYGYVELTDKGKHIASKVYQKHSCISGFLQNVLQLSKKQAEDEACKLEHYLSSKTCSQIHKFMKFYEDESEAAWTTKLKEYMNIRTLNNLSENDTAKVIEIDQSAETNSNFDPQEITPGSTLKYLSFEKDQKTISLLVNDSEATISLNDAMLVKVELI
jgi:DtxR family Mn-dependent transcriptional regulator